MKFQTSKLYYVVETKQGERHLNAPRKYASAKAAQDALERIPNHIRMFYYVICLRDKMPLKPWKKPTLEILNLEDAKHPCHVPHDPHHFHRSC